MATDTLVPEQTELEKSAAALALAHGMLNSIESLSQYLQWGDAQHNPSEVFALSQAISACVDKGYAEIEIAAEYLASLGKEKQHG